MPSFSIENFDNTGENRISVRDDKKNIEFQILTALFDFGFLELVIGDLCSQRLEDDPSNMITWEWDTDGFQM